MEIPLEVLILACFAYGVLVFERAVQTWERATSQNVALKASSAVVAKLVEQLPIKELFRVGAQQEPCQAAAADARP